MLRRRIISALRTRNGKRHMAMGKKRSGRAQSYTIWPPTNFGHRAYLQPETQPHDEGQKTIL